jgi:hypothetical protein
MGRKMRRPDSRDCLTVGDLCRTDSYEHHIRKGVPRRSKKIAKYEEALDCQRPFSGAKVKISSTQEIE